MNPSLFSHRQQAIVVGASLGGLLTARVLSSHFARVTIIEKDPIHRQAESRKGQPQTRHLHALLSSGVHILSQYFPDLLNDIVQQGGQVIDFANAMDWYAYGGFKKRFVIGLDGVLISRPLLEHLIRERVLAIPNIQLLDQTTVTQVIASADQQKVTGVVIQQKENERALSLTADLVVDAAGRGSQTPQWLKAIGYETVPVSEVGINVGYTTRIYERDPDDARGKSWMGCTPQAPQEKRFGGVIPIEGNRWIVTVGGWHGDHAPREEKRYLEFVKSLPNPNIYAIVSTCAPLSPLIHYKFPVSNRRHYEKLSRFPAGYLVLGDAVSSFNPIYAQGMSSACLQAAALDNVLQENSTAERLFKSYFKRVARIVDNIWLIATGEDFRYPETTGPRPPGINIINKYVVRVHRASVRDEVVGTALLKVLALLQPPATLFHPKILWRVLS